VKLFDKLVGKKEKEAVRRSEPLTQSAIQQWLVNRIAGIAQIQADEVEVDRPFADFGLDSIQLFEISGDLQKFMGQDISEIVAWDFPTIAKLSRHLSSPGSEAPASAAVMAASDGNW
jgi:acyl carrier protein